MSHYHKEVEVPREKEPSEVGVRLGSPIDNCAKTSWKEFALNYLVTFGILPNVSLISQNRDVNSEISARFRTGRLRNNRRESRKRMATKMQWLHWRMCKSWVVSFRTESRRDLRRFYGRAQKSWDQFDEYNSQKLRSVTQTSETIKAPSLGKIQVKIPDQRAMKFEDRSQEEIERQGDAPAETRGDWPRRVDAVPKAGVQQAAAGHEGPEPACVLSPLSKVAHAGGEGRINVLPCYRLVRVVSTSSETQGGKTGLPARVNGRHVVRGWQSSPIPECAQVTGKTGENGLYSGEMCGSSPWTRPSAPGCGDTLKELAGDQNPI